MQNVLLDFIFDGVWLFGFRNGISDSRKDWFAVGDYKKLPNEFGGRSEQN